MPAPTRGNTGASAAETLETVDRRPRGLPGVRQRTLVASGIEAVADFDTRQARTTREQGVPLRYKNEVRGSGLEKRFGAPDEFRCAKLLLESRAPRPKP